MPVSVTGRALSLVLLAAPGFALLAGSASAHQSLLFAHVTTRPEAAAPGEPFELLVHLTDSAHRDVSGVELAALLSDSTEDGLDVARRGEGVPAGAPRLRGEAGSGRYHGTMPGRPAGTYLLTIVEVVGGEVETRASAELAVGGPAVDLRLLMPPSGRSGLGTWLVWLVGLPLLAGLLVTLLVLTGRGRSGTG
jgi:hypothetical protein